MDRHRPAGPLLSVEEYLALEERSPLRHEYVAGEVYAMSGATTRHNTITLNLVRHLHEAARAHGCRVFATDVKVRVADRVYYPDVVLACGSAAEVEQIVEEPSLVVEVTSPSTRATDRREKLEAYRRIRSLQAYLIVAQRRRHVLVYARDADGTWLRDEADHGELVLAPLAQRITFDEIYEDVDLPPLGVREEEDDWELYEDPDVP